MTRELSKKLHAAKALKRLAEPPPDYPPIPDYDKPVKEIVVSDLTSGKCHKLTLFVSRKRSDSFRVLVDGKPWKESIGYTHILNGIRKAR